MRSQFNLLVQSGILILFATGLPTFAHAVALKSGDIITLIRGSLTVIDAVTHERTTFSGRDFFTDEPIGSGPELNALAMAVDANGVVYTAGGAGFGPSQVLRVDPATGNRTAVYEEVDGEPAMGAGPAFQNSIGILVESDGGLLVAGSDAVVRIDPVTFDRTIVSDATHGSGPWSPDSFHTGIALDPNGNIILASYFTSEIFRINRVTGDREIISSESIGTGPQIGSPASLVVLDDGTIVFGNQAPAGLYRIDPLTGDRTVLADETHGSGYWSGEPWGLALDPQGNVVFTNADELWRVDPLTGDRTYIQHASGQVGIAVVPATVPEPSTLALLAIGAISLVAWRMRSENGSASSKIENR